MSIEDFDRIAAQERAWRMANLETIRPDPWRQSGAVVGPAGPEDNTPDKALIQARAEAKKAYDRAYYRSKKLKKF